MDLMGSGANKACKKSSGLYGCCKPSFKLVQVDSIIYIKIYMFVLLYVHAARETWMTVGLVVHVKSQ